VSSLVSSKIFCFSCSLSTTRFCRSWLMETRDGGKTQWAVIFFFTVYTKTDTDTKGGSCCPGEDYKYYKIDILLICWSPLKSNSIIDVAGALTHNIGRVDSCVWRCHFPGWGTPQLCSFRPPKNSSPFPHALLGLAGAGNIAVLNIRWQNMHRNQIHTFYNLVKCSSSYFHNSGATYAIW